MFVFIYYLLLLIIFLKLLLTKILRHTIEMVGAPCVHDLLRMATERFKLPKNFDKLVCRLFIFLIEDHFKPKIIF